jgi:acyl-CoA thioesterase FadM
MRVWPGDVDIYLHLNNGRYLTLMDFGRFHLAARTGLMDLTLRRGWGFVVGGAMIRFRRELKLWDRFLLHTRFTGADEKWFYIEQRFEKQGTLHAQAYVRGAVWHRGKTLPVSHVVAALGVSRPSTASPEELRRWEGLAGRNGAVVTP